MARAGGYLAKDGNLAAGPTDIRVTPVVIDFESDHMT